MVAADDENQPKASGAEKPSQKHDSSRAEAAQGKVYEKE
jgi:hypothetical protein